MTGAPLQWVSPLPPTRSGVADYAAEILPPLAAERPVTVVEPAGWTAPESGAAWLALPRVAASEAGDDEPALVHLGNNPYHFDAARWLRRRGGIAVVHDLVLHHLLVEEAAAERRWERFRTELREAYGDRGSALGEARRWGFSGSVEPFVFPATQVLLEFASGAVVHNRGALEHIATVLPELPARLVPLAVDALPGGDRKEWRARLRVDDDHLVLAHLGFLTPAKGLGVVVRAVVALKQLGVPVRLLIVGEGSESSALEAMAAAAGVADEVILWGYAEAAELGGLLSATDLGLVPRFPTAGETSAAALRFFAAGVPVAVSGYRQFLELPAEAAFRLAPGSAGGVDLVRVALRLARGPEMLAGARAAAERQAAAHRPERAAVALSAAVDELLAEAAATRRGPRRGPKTLSS